jgi:hypothetical protein
VIVCCVTIDNEYTTPSVHVPIIPVSAVPEHSLLFWTYTLSFMIFPCLESALLSGQRHKLHPPCSEYISGISASGKYHYLLQAEF